LSLLAVLLFYRASAAGADLERARLLERAFGTLSCCITATVGLMCARVIAGSHDFAINMLMTGLMLASIGTAIRNYYRPRIVHCQLASSIVPAVTGLAIDGSAPSLVMALGTIAYAYNVVEITNGLYRSAVDAFHNDDRLVEQNLRFEAALTNMAQGLVMFDADERLVVCNNKYLQMYGLSGEVVRPGLSLRELLEHSAEVGNHLSGTEAELYEALSQRFGHEKPVSFTHRVDDGRVFSVFHEPMPAGGWVATHEDITERQAAEARIAHMARHDALTGLPNRVQFHNGERHAWASRG
jgi:PAS domain S-box-containing protein